MRNYREDLNLVGIVARRINYGEADRIVDFITERGKISAIAKGVRKQGSKLAGGIEPFTLAKINLVKGKRELYALTSAKMIKFYGGVLENLDRLDLASDFLKKISRMAEQVDDANFFQVLREVLAAIDRGEELQMIKAWGLINILEMTGDELNLWIDNSGARIEACNKYRWDAMEKSFCLDSNGDDSDLIKVMRLMIRIKLDGLPKIRGAEKYYSRIIEICNSVI